MKDFDFRFLSAAIMTFLALSGLAAACSKQTEARDASVTTPFVARYDVMNDGPLSEVREFHLADGTRCVTVYNQGITCEWPRTSR